MNNQKVANCCLTAASFVFQMMNDSYGLECYLFNAETDIVHCVYCGGAGVLNKAKEVYRRLMEKQKIKSEPFWENDDSKFTFFVFQGKEGEGYLFGPIADIDSKETDKRRYCHQHHITERYYNIPRLPWTEKFGLASLLCYSLTGRKYTIKDIEEGNSASLKIGIEALTKSKNTFYIEQDRVRGTYRDEQGYFALIEQGILHQGVEDEQATWARLQSVGIVSETEKKQMEYIAVSGVTLASRAAMRGGLDSTICYELSDLFLQKISIAGNVTEYMQIVRDATNTYSKMVWDKKNERTQDSLIEQCFDYVATHLFHAFNIQQMAEDLAISRTYLSARFTKSTGISIKQYIIGERLAAGVNLLLYSEYSVEAISDYLHFSSVSRFCQYFREKYGVTPQKYRKSNKKPSFTLKISDESADTAE